MSRFALENQNLYQIGLGLLFLIVKELWNGMVM